MPVNDVGFASIESKSHGNVLWAQLDHGIQRIGFSATPEKLARYGSSLTESQAIAEAVKAMDPFTLEFESRMVDSIQVSIHCSALGILHKLIIPQCQSAASRYILGKRANFASG